MADDNFEIEQLAFDCDWARPGDLEELTEGEALRARLSYEKRRKSKHRWERERARKGCDIGKLPDVADPARKAACRENFRLFCETYLAQTYSLAWSEDHLRVIAKIEQAVLKGGLFALAMSRGSGKTSLAESAALWAMIYGHREFVLLVGASEEAAVEMLVTIKTEIESNGLLAEDFPEVAYPIKCLDGVLARCIAQHQNDERTRITWRNDKIVLPTIRGAASSGSIACAVGITGRIRGLRHKKTDGRALRPELVIVDDPQTAESACSGEQIRKRVRLLAADILGLAGPGRKLSGIMPCTVIHPGDMADQILDRNRHPEWNGERCKMVYAFPTNEALWEEYARIRADELRERGTFVRATAFYKEHREAMDEGARVSWPARFNPDEISALQHAMNLKLTDRAAFYAEYQNEPLLENGGPDEQLTIDGVMNKLNGLPRGHVPAAANHLTMFIDIQRKLLFYVICAWGDDFTGYVVDYGAWPEQRKTMFDLKSANPTLQMKYPYLGLEEALAEGLKDLAENCLGRTFRREDGVPMKIERCLIDANWGLSTDVVYRFCRASAFSGVVMPSHGKYYGAGSTPMGEWKRGPGDLVGLNWRVPKDRGTHMVRHVTFDCNYWKSFIASRFFTAMTKPGSVSLWGSDAERHRLFAGHLTAEYRIRKAGCGQSVDEWQMRPDAKDNHWLDGIVGCAVGASMSGCSLDGARGEPVRFERPEPINFSKIKRQMYRPEG